MSALDCFADALGVLAEGQELVCRQPKTESSAQ